TLSHLGADPAYQAHTVRFVENHDEPRLASTLPPAPARAAAVVALTLPGVALLHEGQSDGRQVRVPVTLARRPDEPLDVDLRAWYDRLLGAIDDGMRRGRWSLAAVEGWSDNRSCERLAAWTWTDEDARHLVVVNLSDERADGMVRWPDVPSGPLTVVDVLTGERFARDGTGIAADGLYVALAGWAATILRV
ncbi:MAG: alpha-amylase, partial [Ilumatobacteraceae bacterium]